MAAFRALLIFLFTLSLAAGPVSGVQAAQAASEPCAMHMTGDTPASHEAPAPPKAHDCKTCIGCASIPAGLAGPDTSAAPAKHDTARYLIVSDLHEGRTLAPELDPPRRSL